MKFQSSILLAGLLAISGNASPMPAEAKAGGATTAATGTNVQAFTGAKGGAPPPVIQTTGDRPFSVNGDTFVNSGAALQRSCDVQNNACATEINSGKATGAVSDCNAQQQECNALAKTTAASITAQKADGAVEPQKAAEPKAAEPEKKAEPKVAEPKAAEPKAAEPEKKAEPKAAEPKVAEPKAAEPEKKAEPKAAEPKAAEPKAAEPAKGNTANTCEAVPVEGAKKETEAPKTGATNGAATGATAGAVLPDGRIAQNAVATDFNVLASKFKSAVVKGDGLLFSDLITFPDATQAKQSLFDVAGDTKAFSIGINDKSIFIPKGGAPDATNRRADLLPSIATTLNDVATTGVKTMHFSFQQDAAKPLNLTHTYQVAFLEAADFATHQFEVSVGGADAANVVVTGNNKAAAKETLFTTPLAAGFNNFALTMDFDKNTIQVFHSIDNEPLTQATEALANDMAGNGEYHFAVLKNAVGGAQPTGIDEAVFFGGIFMEDTAGKTATLS